MEHNNLIGENHNSRRIVTLDREDIWGENIYEKVWLPFGDDRESDIASLLQQGRINR